VSEPFIKMHGLGNDFVVFDRRLGGRPMAADEARRVADRRKGIGGDQVITLLPAPEADVFMQIHNADGSEVAACGNATRGVAQILLAEGKGAVRVQTRAGILAAWPGETGVAVDMGVPRFEWRAIPLSRDTDTLHLPLESRIDPKLKDPVAVNMGNPHAVFFVEAVETVDMERIGPPLETDPLFPERANINVATVRGRDEIRLRVWERGAGLTRACGSGACATLVAAVRRDLTARRATVVLDGGELRIEWRDDDHVVMEGPAEVSFTGQWEHAA